MSTYWVSGTDRQVYGPATVEQILGWIDEGRIEPRTQIQLDGSGQWQPASAFPELAEAFGFAAAEPPPGGPTDQEILARDYRVRIGDAVSAGWRVVMDNFGLFVGAVAVQIGISFAASFVPYVGFIVSMIVNPAVTAGLWWICIKKMRGQPAEIGDMFAGFRKEYWGHLIVASLLSSIFIFAGFICLILPGFYLAAALVFAPPLIIDRKMQFWDAIVLSIKMVHKHWWAVFWASIVVGVVAMLGVFVFCVGVLVSAPVGMCAFAVVYNDIFGPRDASQATPAVRRP